MNATLTAPTTEARNTNVLPAVHGFARLLTGFAPNADGIPAAKVYTEIETEKKVKRTDGTVELRKTVKAQTYDLLAFESGYEVSYFDAKKGQRKAYQIDGGLTTCDCGDFEYRQRADGCCKHLNLVKGLKAKGKLPAMACGAVPHVADLADAYEGDDAAAWE
jgi:hypothetical protein